MKAMILAAGRGERLKPLTTVTPKPLVMIGNTTLMHHLIDQLREAGFKEIVINVHHLADQIIAYCGNGERFGVSIHYSVEDSLLETGGGIFQALPILGNEPFLVVSADIWTDYPFQNLLNIPVKKGHLVMVNNPSFHPVGDYGLDDEGFLRDDLQEKLTYGNIAVLHPDLFLEVKPGIFKLNTLLKPAIQSRLMTGEYFSGAWHNIGTMDELRVVRACTHHF